jgi:putative phage-type endonuclease
MNEDDDVDTIDHPATIEAIVEVADKPGRLDCEIGVHDRMGYLGGSDAPIVVAANPYKTRYELYLEKAGLADPEDLSESQYILWGNILEPVVAAEYSRRSGNKTRRVNKLVRDKTDTFLACHLDRNLLNTRGILECKTTGVSQGRNWGEHGSQDIPDMHRPQVQHNMMVTGTFFCDVAVLIGGNDFRIFRIDRDDDYIGHLRTIEREFWHNVMSRIPPAPESYEEALLAWDRPDPGEIEGSVHAYRRAKSLISVQRHVKELEKEAKVLKLDLAAELGDRGDVLTFEGEKLFSWKQQAGKDSIDIEKLASNYPDAYMATVRTGKPYRVLRPSVRLKGEVDG